METSRVMSLLSKSTIAKVLHVQAMTIRLKDSVMRSIDVPSSPLSFGAWLEDLYAPSTSAKMITRT